MWLLKLKIGTSLKKNLIKVKSICPVIWQYIARNLTNNIFAKAQGTLTVILALFIIAKSVNI
jgi:hypothetical protein